VRAFGLTCVGRAGRILLLFFSEGVAQAAGGGAGTGKAACAARGRLRDLAAAARDRGAAGAAGAILRLLLAMHAAVLYTHSGSSADALVAVLTQGRTHNHHVGSKCLQPGLLRSPIVQCVC
jgi:hypothetical protein